MQQVAASYDIPLHDSINGTPDEVVLDIELRLITHPLISECVIVGENEDYYAALLVPDKLRLTQHLRTIDANQVYRLDGYHRLNDIEVRAVFCDLLEELNASLGSKRIERFALLESAGGETREEICAGNRPVIDSLYQDYVPGIG